MIIRGEGEQRHEAEGERRRAAIQGPPARATTGERERSTKAAGVTPPRGRGKAYREGGVTDGRPSRGTTAGAPPDRRGGEPRPRARVTRRSAPPGPPEPRNARSKGDRDPPPSNEGAFSTISQRRGGASDTRHTHGRRRAPPRLGDKADPESECKGTANLRHGTRRTHYKYRRGRFVKTFIQCFNNCTERGSIKLTIKETIIIFCQLARFRKMREKNRLRRFLGF